MKKIFLGSLILTLILLVMASNESFVVDTVCDQGYKCIVLVNYIFQALLFAVPNLLLCCIFFLKHPSSLQLWGRIFKYSVISYLILVLMIRDSYGDEIFSVQKIDILSVFLGAYFLWSMIRAYRR
jgi:hypothetical protein